MMIHVFKNLRHIKLKILKNLILNCLKKDGIKISKLISMIIKLLISLLIQLFKKHNYDWSLNQFNGNRL